MNDSAEIKKESRFRGQILERVYRVWLFRKFLPVFIAEIIIFSAAIYALARYVFISKVIENALDVPLNNPTGLIKFFVAAFENTHTATKVVLVIIVIMVALLIRLITQGILRFILVKKNYFGKANSQ